MLLWYLKKYDFEILQINNHSFKNTLFYNLRVTLFWFMVRYFESISMLFSIFLIFNTFWIFLKKFLQLTRFYAQLTMITVNRDEPA